MAQRTYSIKARHFADFIDRYGDYEAYAFFVAIRSSFRNSKLFSPNVRNVMRFTGCGYNKAKRLLAKAEAYDIFHFAKRHGDLVALTDKDRSMNYRNKYNDYSIDFVYTLSFDDGVGEIEQSINKGRKVKVCKLKDIIKMLKRLYVRHYLSGRTLVHSKASPVDAVQSGGGDGVQFEKHVERRIRLNVIAEKSGLSKSECNRVLEILNKQGEIAKTHRTLVRYEDATPEEQRYCKVLIDKWNRAWVSLTIAYETSVLSLFGGVLRFWNKPKHSPISRSRRHTVRHDLSTDAARYFTMMEIDDALAARRTYKNVR